MDWIKLALSFADQLMKKLPDYEQRQKEKFYKLKKAYIYEKNLDRRDNNRMCKLRDELRLFLESFNSQL